MELIDAGMLVKLTATALMVLTATVMAERTGPFIGAMIVSLPVSAGPAYLFLALEHDVAFIAESARTSLAINAMICPFLLIAAATVRRWGIIASLGSALAVWLAGATTILSFADNITVPIALGMNAAAFGICLLLAAYLAPPVAPRVAAQGILDLVLRVLAVVCVVALVIVAGRLLGPRVAGMAAILPIVWLSTAAIIYARSGPETCATILANGLVGMIGFGAALAALAVCALPLGVATGLLVALAICIAWNLMVMLVRRYAGRRRRPTKKAATAKRGSMPGSQVLARKGTTREPG